MSKTGAIQMAKLNIGKHELNVTKQMLELK